MKKQILLKGPLLTQSGYGHHARTVLRALKTRSDIFDIHLQPLAWGHTSWLWQDDEERRWIDETLQKTVSYVHSGGRFDISEDYLLRSLVVFGVSVSFYGSLLVRK